MANEYPPEVVKRVEDYIMEHEPLDPARMPTYRGIPATQFSQPALVRILARVMRELDREQYFHSLNRSLLPR